MSAAAIIVLLALVWAGITGSLTVLNLLLGAAIGAVAVLILRGAFVSSGAFRRAGKVLSLGVLFLYELMASAIRVSRVVIAPDIRAAIKPAIVAFPLSVKSDAEITLLANLITLTPGTLSVDVTHDRSLLYIHILEFQSKGALVADIAGGFEAKVREIFA